MADEHFHTILYVDDNLIDRAAFGRFFKKNDLPFHISLASSISEARELLTEKLIFDAVIIDFQLGDGLAFDLFKDLKGIPFIIVTGTGNQEIAVKAMKAGAYDYIVKDIDNNHLQTIPLVVENAINRKKVEQELKRYREELEELVQIRTADLRKQMEERLKAERALQISNLRFSSVVTTAKDAIFTVDENEKITDWNRSAENIFGLCEDEAIGLDIKTFIPGFVNTLETNKELSGYPTTLFELDAITNSGISFPVELSLSSWHSGQDIFYTGIVRDIRNRRRKEDAIKFQTSVLSAINKVFTDAMSDSGIEELYDTCVNVLINTTGAKYGFLVTTNNNLIDIEALSEKFYLDGGCRPVDLMRFKSCEIENPIKEIIDTSGIMLHNTPIAVPNLNRIMGSLFRLENMIGFPLVSSGKVFGVICLGSKKGGFTKSDTKAVELISYSLTETIKRKKTEIKLKDSRKRMGLALRGANIGMWDYLLDSERIRLDARASSLLGLGSEVMSISYRHWESTIDANDVGAVVENLREHIAGNNIGFSADYRVQNSKQNTIWIMNRAKIVEYSSEGIPVRLTGTMLDITKRREAEEEIRKLNVELEHKVMARTADLANAMEELQFENNERKKIQDRLEQTNYELKILNDALAEESHKLIKLNDKLIESEKELKLANDSKDKFFSIIAHDLKNPLQGLLLSSEILQNLYDKGETKTISKHIVRVNNTAMIIRELLENLLTWSRSKLGAIDFSPSRHDLYDDIQSTIILCQIAADKKSILVSSDVKIDTYIYADKNMISTILSNLVFNAIKFSHKHSEIKLLINDAADYVTVTVRDRGIGIPEDAKNKLFQIDKVYTTKGTEEERGTGLGLLICREFVETNGGQIWVESMLNKGSDFKFTIPKA